MKDAVRKKLAVIAGVCAIACGGLQQVILPLYEKNFMPRTADLGALTGEQLLFSLAGFREMIAGILWVRADAFFDEGNYDAVLPIIRIVTYLDPKQIDVYATGMWHIAYNFTDQGSRADRRNIPIAVAFGAEGARNNSYTYELFFETGWLWYHRIQDDFQNAVYWFEEAAKREDITPARRNLLSYAYQRNGQVDKSLETFYTLYERAQKLYEANKNDRGAFTNMETIEGNLDNLLVRMSQRGYFASQRGDSSDWIYDVNPPFDVGFSASVTVVEPRKLRVEGTWNVFPVGTRVRMMLRDADYPIGREGGLKWDQGDAQNFNPPRELTYMQDELFVRNQRFSREIDMSRDPTIYPFTKQNYVIDFFYTPRVAPEHIKDKFGWNGEGMTDKNFLNTEIRPDQRVVFYRMELTRDMIDRTGEWSMAGGKTPVISTPNWVAPRVRNPEEDFVRVPGLRSGQ